MGLDLFDILFGVGNITKYVKDQAIQVVIALKKEGWTPPKGATAEQQNIQVEKAILDMLIKGD